MATKIPFIHEYDFDYGTLDELTPLVRRVTARNPSGFTFHGTGTYVIGRGNVAVIDPGPLLLEETACYGEEHHIQRKGQHPADSTVPKPLESRGYDCVPYSSSS